MTYEQFTELGYTLTEQEAKALRREILSIYNELKKTIQDQIQEQYAILAGVDPDNFYNEMLKYNRLNNLFEQLQADYLRLTNKAFKLQYQVQELYFTNNYYRQLYAMSWIEPMIPGLLPADVVQLSVYGTDKAFKRYSAQLAELYGAAINYQPQAGTLRQLLSDSRDNELKAIRRAITQGFINGDSYTKQVNIISDILGKEMAQQGILTGAKANAMRIMRSEGTRNMNAASYASSKYAESQGVKMEKQWMSALDIRTRQTHGAADGQRVKIDSLFTVGGEQGLYPGDFPSAKNNANCRCTTVNILNGNNPKSRRGRNPTTGENEVFEYKNYNQWLEDNDLKYKNGTIVKN